MGATRKADRDVMSRLGLLAHLEAMRGDGLGIQNIETHDCAAASSTALRVWEDSNFPYRLPVDLRAFLSASNGFSLAWTARQHVPPGVAKEIGGEEGVVVGRVCVDPLSAITRIPLDADDLRDMASSRARAAAAAAAAARARSLPHRRPSPPSSSPAGDGKAEGVSGAGIGERRPIGRPGATDDGSPSSDGFDAGGSYSAYGIAAFSLDSSCEVGRVALVYGGAPTTGCVDGVGAGGPGDRGLGNGSNNRRERSRGGAKASVAQELSSPEVWLQDLSCRWHFLADDFTSYFRMMVVHLGVLGWQQAFTPVGLSPNTKQSMRLYCPDRLLFDQLEWQAERASSRAASEAAAAARHS